MKVPITPETVEQCHKNSEQNFQPRILYPVILSIEHETRQVILRHGRSQNILPLLHSCQEDMVRCTLSNKEENQERGRH